jgi:hypothetical protein
MYLVQISGRATALKNEYKLRTTRIRGVLAADRLKDPDAIETASRGRFWRWWWLIAFLYVALVLTAAGGAITAPGPLAPLLGAAQPTTSVPPLPAPATPGPAEGQ